MTANVFRASDGKIATYAGPGDAPFTDPIANLNSVGFHSDFNYVTFSHTKTFANVALDLNYLNSGRSYLLGTHDAPAGAGIPILFGRLTAISGTVGGAGSQGLFAAAPRSLQGACAIDRYHLLSLAWDATNVYLTHQYLRYGYQAPSRTLTVEITVMNQRLPA